MNSQVRVQDKVQWQSQLTQQLRNTQRELAQKAIDRNWTSFTPLLRSGTRSMTIYDWMRWLLAKLTLRRFDPKHGDGFPLS